MAILFLWCYMPLSANAQDAVFSMYPPKSISIDSHPQFSFSTNIQDARTQRFFTSPFINSHITLTPYPDLLKEKQEIIHSLLSSSLIISSSIVILSSLVYTTPIAILKNLSANDIRIYRYSVMYSVSYHAMMRTITAIAWYIIREGLFPLNLDILYITQDWIRFFRFQ